jgi:hypothetical protein
VLALKQCSDKRFPLIARHLDSGQHLCGREASVLTSNTSTMAARGYAQKDTESILPWTEVYLPPISPTHGLEDGQRLALLTCQTAKGNGGVDII